MKAIYVMEEIDPFLQFLSYFMYKNEIFVSELVYVLPHELVNYYFSFENRHSKLGNSITENLVLEEHTVAPRKFIHKKKKEERNPKVR